jgi:hypothetical protein
MKASVQFNVSATFNPELCLARRKENCLMHEVR